MAQEGRGAASAGNALAPPPGVQAGTFAESQRAQLDRNAARIAMGKNPGEVAFFKLLYSELKKAQHFFGKAEEEFIIREERVREGMSIMKKPNSIMLINDRWSVIAKSLYRLYKDLLLLETFAIMTYCSFSKILKKHDKVTGHNTRSAFMKNVVDKANFTNYPRTLEMIQRIERLYAEVSDLLAQEGKQSLYEDERLFINMIHRLNEQAMNTAEAEGAPDVNDRKEKRGVASNATAGSAGSSNASSTASDVLESSLREATSSIAKASKKRPAPSFGKTSNSLRAAVEENEWNEQMHADVPPEEPHGESLKRPASRTAPRSAGSVSDEGSVDEPSKRWQEGQSKRHKA